ncbi:MAG: translocation/assembly module TamB domain-containing protein, partial [Candidatus Kapaibacterium sp.]
YFTVSLNADNVYPSNIQEFTPLPVNLDEKYNLALKADGKLNLMNIKDLRLTTDETYIMISGFLRNLDQPDEFNYDLVLDGSKIYKKDVTEALPSMDLTSLPDMSYIEFQKMDAWGSSDSAHVSMQAISDIGRLSGTLSSGFGDDLTYSADIDFNELELAPITKSDQMQSTLNGSIKLDGSGTELSDLRIDVDAAFFKSTYSGFSVDTLAMKSRIADSRIFIDTLIARAPINISDTVYGEETIIQQVYAGGYFDLPQVKSPQYNLNIDFSDISASNLLDNDALPRMLGGKLHAEGTGFHPDSIEAGLKADFEQVFFGKVVLMPFTLEADIERMQGNKRKASLNSQFLNAKLEGEYRLTDLINSLADQGTYLASFFSERMNILNPSVSDTLDKKYDLPKKSSFHDIDAVFTADITDMSPLSTLLEDISLTTNARLSFHYYTHDEVSSLELDSLSLTHFSYESEDMLAASSPIILTGKMTMEIRDSVPEFKMLNLNLEGKGNTYIDDMIITGPDISMNFDGNKLDYKISSDFNREWNFMAAGNMLLKENDMNFQLDQAKINYKDEFVWKNDQTIQIDFLPDGFEIKTCELSREKKEQLKLSGALKNNEANDLTVALYNFDLGELKTLLPADQPMLSDFKGKIDSVRLTVFDDLKSPYLQMKISADNLVFDKVQVGMITGDLNYKDKNLSGDIKILSGPDTTIKHQLATVSINRMPIYLGIDTLDRFPENKSMDIKVEGRKMPLALAAPFIPTLERLRGYAKLNVNISGKLPEDIEYSGDLDIKETSFILAPTNVSYLAEGKISLNNDEILIDKIILANHPENDVRGKAEVTGKVELEDFSLSYLDINIMAKDFIAMTDATQSAMPNLYGDLIFSTGPDNIRFHGTLDKPNLTGDINVNRAELQMPELSSKQSVRTELNYEFISDTLRIKGETKPDSVKRSLFQQRMKYLAEQSDTTEEQKAQAEISKDEKNIADLINYDLNLMIPGRFLVDISLGILGNIQADIGTANPEEGLRYVKNRDEDEPRLYGALILKEGSTLKYVRAMEVEGNITFRTGAMDNPTLDLTARYQGLTLDENNRRPYTVIINVTGSQENPEIDMTYTIDGETPPGDKSKITQDAAFLLLTGQTKSSALSGSGSGGQIFDETELGGSVLSSAFSKSIIELLNTGYIQNLDIDFASGPGQEQTKVKLSGRLFGGATYTFGGAINDFKNNNEFRIDIPIDVFQSNKSAINRFLVQIKKSSADNTTAFDVDQIDWEIKLKFGGNW